jgi:hypothetical protein
VIVAAALLVLVALGLFIGGIATGLTALYWACVAVSALAAVLLIVARIQLSGLSPRRTAVAPHHTLPADGDGADVPGDSPPGTGTGGAPAVGAPAPGHDDGAAAERSAARSADAGEENEPPVEEVEVTDLLLVVDLHDDVFVVDEHPRYHLAGCRSLAGLTAIPLPVDEARTDGFTPCGVCAPDRHLAGVERTRRASRGTL